jgi:hypothetical protein
MNRFSVALWCIFAFTELRYHGFSWRHTMSVEFETPLPGEESAAHEKSGASALRVITWFSVGMAVAAVGIVVGAELRSRYRFKHRTPYDFYASAGERHAGEFGVGI